jgi:anti-anti-sigma regulatory factor
MAANFRIHQVRNSDSLHLKLMGDFDGTSAYELMHTLDACKDEKKNIFIHTSSLQSIYDFGVEVFQKNCDSGRKLKIIVTGQHATEIAPKGSRLI